MKNSVLFDNWTLQDIGILIRSGIIDRESKFLLASRSDDSFEYFSRKYYTVQIECLFKLLNDIVLRDSILIDSRFSEAWKGLDSIEELHGQNIIRYFDPLDSHLLADLTNQAVDKLCITKGMKRIQSVNEEQWRTSNSVADNMFSQIVWGLAGYLGRSSILGAAYSAHPTRNFLLDGAIFEAKQRDVTTELVEWAKNEGSSVFDSHSPDTEPTVAQLVVSPIAAEVIENTSSVSGLVHSALAARKKYQDLRKWIIEYQQAIDHEDFRETLQRKKQIQSVSRNIERLIDPSPNGQTTLSFGFSFLGLSNPVSLPNLKQKFGIRKTFNNLILSKRGKSIITKVLRLFGVDNPAVSAEVSKYL